MQALHRRVFFVAGFDPKSPRFYHRLYRRLAGQRPPPANAASADAVSVSRRRHLKAWADEWDVDWHRPDHPLPLRTRYTLLRWDDIVRAHWTRDTRTVWRDHWKFYVEGALQGNFGRVWRASRRNWVFIMFPVVMATVWVLGWAASAALLGAALLPAWVVFGSAWHILLITAAVGAAMASWRGISHRLGTDWLMRLYGFSHAQAAGEIDGLEERVNAMAALIADAAVEHPEARELLIVGHSTGASIAASALARALALRPELGASGTQVGLLTLGHCTPLVAYFRAAREFRQELDSLVSRSQVTWVDYTAPADWAGCGDIAPWLRGGPALLHKLSPRFHKVLNEEHYTALRRNRLAMHMQYLKPVDRAGGYDLLELTAGPFTLRERHPPPGWPATHS